MFRRQNYSTFLKQPPTYRTTVFEPGAECVESGLIETMGLGGCTSCAILSDGDNKLGAITHYRAASVDEHLKEILRLTRIYTKLKNAKNVALFWDRANKESRCNPNGNVYRLVTGLREIFTGIEIEEIPYDAINWYGVNVDEGTLVFQ
jgi:hypothetical protein